MEISLLGIVTGLLVVVVVLQLILLLRGRKHDVTGLANRLEHVAQGQQRTESVVREEIAGNRTEMGQQAEAQRKEVGEHLKGFTDSVHKQMTDIASLQKSQLDTFATSQAAMNKQTEERLEAMRSTLEKQLKYLQEENAKKLDQMRQTVDEKLQSTLEKRLGESFKLVSDRLEQVHKGLGEMQNLASGVGDLKRMLTNVKKRGTWGEIQLGNLLEEIMTPAQYERNVATVPGSNNRVEFAIRLPGKDEQDDDFIWLPIDAKFPLEDYERLMLAAEEGNRAGVDTAARQLERAVQNFAKDINEKYLSPPATTDFAIMYLPSEGLYAEVLRRPGLVDNLQRTYRVNVTGPTTLAALLNSLQLGFRTLAIQKRSSEVWQVLGAVKTEFGKFGEMLGKLKKRLESAQKDIGNVERRSRVMTRRLKDVEALPSTEAGEILQLTDPLLSPDDETEDED